MKNSTCKEYFKKNTYWMLSFIIPLTILLLVYMFIGIYPFGDKSVLLTDGGSQYVDFFAAFRRLIIDGQSPLFSWSKFLGGNMLALIAYYLSSPFSLIMALFPQSMIQEAMLFVTLLKIGLCGLTFSIFLNKSFNDENSTIKIIIFSTMYALMGYTVVYSVSLMWLDAVIFLPLVVLGIQNIINNKGFLLYSTFLGLTLISTYYIGFMVCIFSVLYFIYYYITSHTFKDNVKAKDILHTFIRFALSSVLAGGLAAVILLPTYFSLKTGKMEFNSDNLMFFYNFAFPHFTPKFLPGIYDTITYPGLPNIYSGVLTLILIPMFFLNRNIKIKEKVSSLIFIIIFIASLYINTLNVIWHGFQHPMGFPYRYSFLFSFFIIMLAYKCFRNLKGLNLTSILATYIVVLFSLIIILKKLHAVPYVESKFIILSIILATLYTILIACMIYKPSFSKACSIVLLFIVSFEAFVSSNSFIHHMDKEFKYYTRSEYVDFLNEAKPAVDYVKNKDSEFYRMEKTFTRSINDSFALGYYGTSTFSSSFEQSTLDFLRAMGQRSYFYISEYAGSTIPLDSLLSVKYILSKDPLDVYEKISTIGNVSIYKNPYVLPLGFMVNSNIKDIKLYNENPFKLQNSILDTISNNPKDETWQPIKINNIKIENLEVNDSEKVYNKMDKTKDAFVTYNISVENNYPIYAYFHTLTVDNPNDVYVNNKKVDTADGFVNYLGTYDKNESLEVKIKVNNTFTTSQGIFYYLNLDNLKSLVDTAKEHCLTIDQFNDTHIIGNIEVTTPGTLFTSIPFDKGWKVKVDGKSVETIKLLGGLTGINLEQGNHKLEFKYSPEGFKPGALISIISLLICIFFFIKCKHKKNYS